MRIFFSLLICLSCLFVRGQLNNDVYDLDFRNYSSSNFSWVLAPFIAGEGGCYFFVDSLNLFDDKFPVGFHSLEMFPGSRTYFRFRTHLVQQMYIPDSYQQLEFILKSKSQNIVQAWLKVTALNSEEQFLGADSVQIINNSEDWSVTTLKISVSGAVFYRVEIFAKGEEDWLKASGFFIDRMQILGNGRNINWAKVVPALAESDFECIGSWTESVLPLIEHKRIIALAETVHGDSAIAVETKKLVSILVRQGKCKLLLWELPYDYALLINLYIQGNPEIKSDELLRYAQKAQFSSDFSIAFLDELKEYNHLHTEKVSIVGIDPISWNMRYLSRFVECVSGNKITPELSEIMKLLAEGKAMKIIEKFSSNKRLTEDWGKRNIYWFLQALQQLLKQEKSRKIAVGNSKGKESVMKDNIFISIDSLLPENKKAVVIGHWLHLNKINNISPVVEKSCGYYLNRRFKDQYWVMGILKGEGQILGRTPVKKKIVLHKLDLFHGAQYLENLCSKKMENLTIGNCLKKDQIGWIRLSGGYASRLLCMPVALKQRMDCFLWVK